LFLALFLLLFIIFAVLLVRPRVEKKEDTGGEREESSFLIPTFLFFRGKNSLMQNEKYLPRPLRVHA